MGMLMACNGGGNDLLDDSEFYGGLLINGGFDSSINYWEETTGYSQGISFANGRLYCAGGYFKQPRLRDNQIVPANTSLTISFDLENGSGGSGYCDIYPLREDGSSANWTNRYTTDNARNTFTFITDIDMYGLNIAPNHNGSCYIDNIFLDYAIKPFVFNVTSPTQPGYSATGGTITTTDNGDGTWTLESNDAITKFKFDTNKEDITEILLLSATDLTDINRMCYLCSNLTKAVFDCDLSKVLQSQTVFQQCGLLTEMDISMMTNIYAIDHMFRLSGVRNVIMPDLSSAGTGSYVFRDCNDLVCIDKIDTTSMTDKTGMFNGCSSLVAPNATEQADLVDADGAVYVNPNPCP